MFGPFASGSYYHFTTEFILINRLGIYRTPIEVYQEYGSELIGTCTIGEEVRAGVKPVDKIRVRVRVWVMGYGVLGLGLGLELSCHGILGLRSVGLSGYGGLGL